MNRVRFFLRRFAERIRRLFRRSPDPPVRLLEEPTMFRVYYPGATIDEWESFAIRLASNAYQAGFVRGLVWKQRGWKLDDSNADRLVEVEAAKESLGDLNPFMARVLKAKGDENDPLYGVSEPNRQAFFALLERHPFYATHDMDLEEGAE